MTSRLKHWIDLPGDSPDEPTTEELAKAAFETNEYVMALAMRNTAGLDYTERQKLAIEYAVAMEAATKARVALENRTRGFDL